MARVDSDYTDHLNAEQEQEALDMEAAWRQTVARQVLLANGWAEQPVQKEA